MILSTIRVPPFGAIISILNLVPAPNWVIAPPVAAKLTVIEALSPASKLPAPAGPVLIIGLIF